MKEGKTLSELANLVEGEVVGDGSIYLKDIRPIDEAEEGDLTFLTNPRYRALLEKTKASAILTSTEMVIPGKNFLVSRNPYVALGKIISFYYPPRKKVELPRGDTNIDERAQIAANAVIYPGVTICRGAKIEKGVILYPGVFIGEDVSVGEDSILYPHVCIYHGCRIGKRVILHAGVVIGADGFGFAMPGVENIKIPQVGVVQIDDDVEIGANTTVDRATLGKTWIKRGVKIDNLVQIGHNVVIEENAVIVSQVGISGSTKIGRGVIIGGQAGLVGHITIGNGVMIGAQSGIHEDVPDGQVVSGSPHLPHQKWLRVVSCLADLPELRKEVKRLKEEIKKLWSEKKVNR